MTLRVKDVMQREVRSVRPDLSLEELQQAFFETRVSGFPVLSDGRLVGLITRSDVVRKLATDQSYAGYLADEARDRAGFASDEGGAAAAASDSRLAGVFVRDVMSHSPVSVPSELPLLEACKLLRERGFHRLPVVDGEELVGFLTTLDIVGLVADGSLSA